MMLRRCAADSGLLPLATRAFSVSTRSAALNPTPLTNAHPLTDSDAGVLLDFPVLRNAKYTPFEDAGTKVTKLPSGTVVVSRDAPDPIAAVGVFLSGGVAAEGFAGTSHLMRHMTFQRSYSRSPLAVNRSLEELTPRFSAVASRDFFVYSAEVNRGNIDTLYEYISDMRYPKPHEYIIRDIADNIRAESVAAQSDPLVALVEDIHKEAYRDVGYGKSLYAPLYNVGQFSPEHVDAFCQTGNLVVVGYGTEHDELLNIVGEGEQRTVGETPSAYKGGERRTAGPGNTRVAVVFEGPSIGDEKWAAAQVLKGVAGGASRISKDGPGRGTTGRLYTGVAASDDNVQAASSFSRSYAKSGLFGAYAESAPGHAESTTLALAKALSSLGSSAGQFSAEELARGKRQAKAVLAHMSRADRVEMMGSLAIAGANPHIDNLAQAIDGVSAADVATLAQQIFSSPPTLVANGDIEGVPTREEVAALFK